MKVWFYFSLLSILFIIVGCSSSNKGDKSDSKEDPIEVNGLTYDKAFEIVNVETGWKRASKPFVKIKLRNVTGTPITDKVEVKYAFIQTTRRGI